MKRRERSLTMTASLLRAGAVLIFLGVTGFAWGHGADKHREPDAMTDHMQAMVKLKESIPSEYRIMDRTPVTPSHESLHKGKELFLANCSVCHGSGGAGDGPAAAALDPVPANFLDLKHSAIYGPGEKFWIIGNGSGKTGMPGFSGQIEPLGRWHLVNFIYSLQQGKAGHSGHDQH